MLTSFTVQLYLKILPYGKILSAVQLGSLIRQKRKKAGIVQTEAAGLLDVGTRFLSEIERGKETAEIGKILQVLNGLGLDMYIVPRGSKLRDIDEK